MPSGSIKVTDNFTLPNLNKTGVFNKNSKARNLIINKDLEAEFGRRTQIITSQMDV